MKILLVHDTGFIAGGAEVLVAQLKKMLKSRGHTVAVFTMAHPANSFADYVYINRGSNNFSKAFLYTWNSFAKAAFQKVLIDFKPDIIHLHTITKMSSAILLDIKKIPIIMTVHNFGVIDPTFTQLPSLAAYGDRLGDYFVRTPNLRFWTEKFRHRFIRKHLRRVNQFLPVSHFLAQVMKEYQPRWPTQVVHPGIEVHNQQIPKLKPVVLCVGRFVKEKGFTYVLQAASLLIHKNIDLSVILVGDGPEKKALENESKKLGISSSILFTGYIRTRDIEKYYRKSCVVAVPSLWPEPFGLSGLEAFGMGLPTIASDVGGIPEWLDSGKNGFLIPPANPLALSQTLLKVLSDKKLYSNLALGAFKTARKFTWNRYVTEQEKIYTKLVKENFN